MGARLALGFPLACAAVAPHVLLLMTDQQRVDSLTAYRAGTRAPDGRSLTPNLDRLARDGARFTSAYSSTPTCTPARLALTTGRSPWSHTLLGYVDTVPGKLPGSFVRLGDAMAANGYATAAIGKLHYGGGATHGFEHVDLYDGARSVGSCKGRQAHLGGRRRLRDAAARLPRAGARGAGFGAWFRQRMYEDGRKKQKQGVLAARDAQKVDCTGFALNGLSWNSWQAAPWPYSERTHPTVFVGDRASAFLKRYARNETRPLFLFVSFHRPHPPFDPPRRLFKAFANASRLPARAVGAWATEWWPRHGKPRSTTREMWTGDVDSGAQARARRAYYASVAHVDEQIGVVLGAWRALPHSADDGAGLGGVVLFLSDHGEMLGDHLLFRKGYAYEGSARVPLLVRWPAAFAPHIATPRGGAVSAPVEIRDILPTLLDAAQGATPRARQPLEHTRGGGLMDGRSLFELLRGGSNASRAAQRGRVPPAGGALPRLAPLELGEPAPPWREWIGLEHDQVYDSSVHWSALTDGRVKYIYHAFSGREQLFDLARDPNEMADLAAAPAHAATLKLWRSRLIAQFEAEGRGSLYVRRGHLAQRRGKDSSRGATKRAMCWASAAAGGAPMGACGAPP